jgi:hypothetical protein
MITSNQTNPIAHIIPGIMPSIITVHLAWVARDKSRSRCHKSLGDPELVVRSRRGDSYRCGSDEDGNTPWCSAVS